jgi:hypothetical protein
MTSDSALLGIVSRLSLFREFDGCVIGYEGDGECRVLAKARPISSTYRCVAVVIEKVEDDAPSTIDELEAAAQAPAGATRQTDFVSNRSRVGSEMVGTGITCGLTIVSALGMAAGVAGEVATGGLSSFLVVASWTGLATGGLQCLNGLVRVGAAFRCPRRQQLAAVGFVADLFVCDLARGRGRRRKRREYTPLCGTESVRGPRTAAGLYCEGAQPGVVASDEPNRTPAGDIRSI